MGIDGKHRSLVNRAVNAAWVMLCLLGLPQATDAACRQALALGLDVSGSVDANDYRLQRQGLATALGSDAVRQVLLRQPDAPVWITVFEWSGPNHQHTLQPWIAVTDLTLPRIAQRLTTLPRVKAPPTTALGSAMAAGVALLQQRPDCWRHTLDLSGDGPANTGPRPQDLIALPRHITINGLVIGPDVVIGPDGKTNHPDPDAAIDKLTLYYTAYVIRGADAFVETARGFDDYAAAMERKLLRELRTIAIGQSQ